MKRLKKTVHSKNTTRKKNNGGMTYIELLVALSLLVLVVTMFSPMLLRSYDSLYKAGEMTEFAYDARSKIEEGLSIRENDNFYNIQTNFEKLSDTVSIKARQIVSSVNGLETLYGGARGRIKVVSDSVVSDNQDAQVVRLLVTNLDRDKYTFKSAASATVAKNPGDGEVLFYICSAFNDTVQLEYTFTEVAETNFIDVFIKDINVTKGPIKFYAYFKDDFGVIKKAETYVYIEPADMMFVGDSDSQDYFTSAGVDAEKGTFFIAGRQMATAPIGGEMLNDVEWVGTENDSSILDGYYLMCGENSVVRRLWRARDSSKSDNITYKTTAINGNAYFQYDWKGDYTDRYSYISKKNAGNSGYGTSSTDENSVPVDKDVYGLNKSSYVFAYNGHAGNWDDRDQMSKRISYILYADKGTAAAAGMAPQKGFWTKIRYRAPSTGKKDWVYDMGDQDEGKETVYNTSNSKWYARYGKKDYREIKDPNGNTYTGPNIMVDRLNGMYHGAETFFRRNGVPEGKSVWDTTSLKIGNDTFLYEWQDDSVDKDEEIAYVTMKIYNNFSSDDLGNSGESMPSAPTNNPINLTSCTVLPGKTGDALYLGWTNANALFQQTNATDAANTDTRAAGLFTGYPAVSGVDSNGIPHLRFNVYTQDPDWYSAVVNGASASPRSEFAAEQYAANPYNGLGWGAELPNVYFTMGYASDLFTMYNTLSEGDTKPLEDIYKLTNGYKTTDINDTIRSNMWLTREFCNIIESDSYEKSIIAVGYNVAGLSTVQYNKGYLVNAGKVKYLDLVLNFNGAANNWTAQFTNGSYTKTNYTNSNYATLDIGDNTTGYWIKIPEQVVASTALKTILNDGVLAVYNEGDETFQNIYYYRDPGEASVRFNCVSTIGITDSIVGAAVGLSDGKVMLARIPYNNGKLVTTPLTNASCTFFDAIPEISSITAIKAFQYDINGDETPENLIVAGGTKVTDKTFVIRINDINTPSKHYKIVLKEAVKVTDFAIVNGYLYISAIQSNGKGIVYTVSLKNLTAINGKDVVTSSGTYITLGDSVLVPTKKYYTEFAVDIDDGAVIGSGSSTDLPVINSIAAKAEQ